MKIPEFNDEISPSLFLYPIVNSVIIYKKKDNSIYLISDIQTMFKKNFDDIQEDYKVKYISQINSKTMAIYFYSYSKNNGLLTIWTENENKK